MNRPAIIAVALAAAIATGILIGRGLGTDDGRGPAAPAEREILYWVAPMDASYRRDQPGKSPMGMDLVPVYADEAGRSDPAVVSIAPGIVNNLGVRTAPAAIGPLARRVETVGYVGYDEDTVQHVHTRVDGWIERLAIKAAGDPVSEGQLLFELYSPTLVNAQQEYLAAKNSGNQLLLDASRARLLALGVTGSEIARLDRERSIEHLVSIFADTAGYAAELGVREGIFVTPATEIMSIASLDPVWILAEVFERQAPWVEEGQRAEVEFDYLRGHRWEGTVDYVYPELDPDTRTLTVRLRFDNEHRVMRPNMLARITIYGAEIGPVVHVPREALIRGGAANRVVLALGGGRFRSQPVAVGIESGDRVEIREGLNPGDVVVTSGQFLIDSESNIDSALTRMEMTGIDPRIPVVRVRAVVRDTDSGSGTATLDHDPVPAWSWPAMSMRFEVADPSLLDGLERGDVIEVTVEDRGDGRFVVTAVDAAEDRPPDTEGDAGGRPDDMAQDGGTMDHSGHDMGAAADDSGAGTESPQ